MSNSETSPLPSLYLQKVQDRLEKLELEQSFRRFIEYVFKHYYGREWVHNWHHDEIIKLVESLEARDIPNAVINMPPRYGKTELAVVLWICWTIARNPQAQFIHVSYSAELALKNSAQIREILKSSCIQKHWPIKMRDSQDSKGLWLTEQGGGLIAVQTGGAITGFGAGITSWQPGQPFDGCFVAGTKISTVDGAKAINELRAGDSVLSYNHATQSIEPKTIVAIKESTKDAIVKVTTDRGRVIYCTPCHRFFDGTTYRAISEFKRGDRLVSCEGTTLSKMQLLFKGVSSQKVGYSQIYREWAKSSILLTGLFAKFRQNNRKAAAAIGKMLHCLRQNIYSILFRIGHMFHGVQEPLAFAENARGREFKLQERGKGLFGSVSEDEAIGKGKGWGRLFNLRLCNSFNCSSHKSRQNGQLRRESNNTLSIMSYNTSQISCDTISSVEEYGSGKTTVYDIQVAENNNFFAEGILVHNCILIDDPLKPDDAKSDVMRSSANARLAETLHSRKNHSRVPMVIIMQRLHEDDASGVALSGGIMGDDFHHLKLQAIHEGEALWPYKHTLEQLKLMQQSNRQVFAGQYQQEPYIEGGEVYKLDWFGRYTRLPDDVIRIVHSWDTAYKAGTHNDPSCCTVWHVTATAYYLAEVHCGRWEYPELRKRAFSLAAAQKPHAILIEDKASGQSLIQEFLGASSFPVIPIKPEGDKETRARTTASLAEAGRIILPETAAWLSDYEQEMLAFPNGKHDDRVDSTSQFLSWMRTNGTGDDFMAMLDRLYG